MYSFNEINGNINFLLVSLGVYERNFVGHSPVDITDIEFRRLSFIKS